jgi:hypothetical protein
MNDKYVFTTKRSERKTDKKADVCMIADWSPKGSALMQGGSVNELRRRLGIIDAFIFLHASD